MTIHAVLFDLDGTIVESWKTTPLPGIPDLLQYLRQNNISIGVATNQAGLIRRKVTGQEKYPTPEKMAQTFLVIAENLNILDALWLISVWKDEYFNIPEEQTKIASLEVQKALYDLLEKDFSSVFVSSNPEWRKPKPDMLLAACREWLLRPSEVLYVGDMATDEQAAKNAGVPFCWNYDITNIPGMLQYP